MMQHCCCCHVCSQWSYNKWRKDRRIVAILPLYSTSKRLSAQSRWRIRQRSSTTRLSFLFYTTNDKGSRVLRYNDTTKEIVDLHRYGVVHQNGIPSDIRSRNFLRCWRSVRWDRCWVWLNTHLCLRHSKQAYRYTDKLSLPASASPSVRLPVCHMGTFEFVHQVTTARWSDLNQKAIVSHT